MRRAADDYLGGYYELPGGGVDEGETIQDAALREVAEGTGLVPAKVIAVFKGFDYSTDKKPWVRQVNFLVEPKPGDVTLSAEHDHCIWVDERDVLGTKTTDSMIACVKDALAIAKG
ncbi:MAG TPA: NUDIX hydrolase [Candidatus Saccharimonadales bacterium]